MESSVRRGAAATSPAVCPTCGASDWGTRNRCKPCRARASRQQWQANLDASRRADSRRHRAWRAARPEKARAQKRRQRYDLSVEEFEALLVMQDRRCAICRSPDPDCVDHCHGTGAIRGILCRACNAGLGQFRDDPERLGNAVSYLLRAKA